MTDRDAQIALHNKSTAIAANHLYCFLGGIPFNPAISQGAIVGRAVDDGESSAGGIPCSDESSLILVSISMHDTLIAMANLVTFYDVSVGVGKLTLRRRTRMHNKQVTVATLTAMFRYLVISQRLTGRPPHTIAALDPKSASVAAQVAYAAVLFVVAHELAHLGLGHESMPESPLDDAHPDGMTVSELQELQADRMAFGILTEMMPDDPESVTWAAFIALFSRQITETALLLRRTRSHPRGYVRWGMLADVPGESDTRGDRLRADIMAAVGAALKKDEVLPADAWFALDEDRMLGLDPGVSIATLAHWDRLQTCELARLRAEVLRDTTAEGRDLLRETTAGNLEAVLAALRVHDAERNAILDRSRPLSFFALKAAIDRAPFAATTGDRLAYSVLGARLAAPHLRGGHIDDW